MNIIARLEPGEVLNSKDFSHYEKRNTGNRVEFVCIGCNETKTLSLQTYFKKVANETLCHECTISKRKLERYGDAGYCNPDKIKKTTYERFGVDNVSQLQSVKDEKERKSYERYGESMGQHWANA